MKATAKDITVDFTPFKLEIEVQTLEEAQALYNIFNHGPILNCTGKREELVTIWEAISNNRPGVNTANSGFMDFCTRLKHMMK